jgi:hypothetical protein
VHSLFLIYLSIGSRNSVASIATRYGLEGQGIESRWGEIFRTYPARLRGPPSLLYNGYRVFAGGKGGRGVMLTAHPLLVPRLRKSWSIPPLTLWVLLGLFQGSPFFIFINLYTVWYAGSTMHTRQSSAQNNKYQVSHKHSCFSWWWAHSCPKHVEIDIYTKNLQESVQGSVFSKQTTHLWILVLVLTLLRCPVYP